MMHEAIRAYEQMVERKMECLICDIEARHEKGSDSHKFNNAYPVEPTAFNIL